MTQLNPLAVSAASLLRAIAAGAPATRTELAEQAGRQRSNIARDLGQLAEAGLITADQIPTLTDDGRAQLAAINVAEGLSAGDDHAAPPTQLLHGQILPDPDNARRDWDSEDAEAELWALADDIRENGLLQNLVVRPLVPATVAEAASARGASGSDPQYLLVGGERRWRALGMLLATGHWRADQPIPVRVLEHDDDVAVRLAALSENLQRRDLNPIEEARAFQALRTLGLATADIAERVGRTQRHVQMRLQLLECLTPEQQHRMTLPESDPKRLSVRDARQAVQLAEAKRKARDAAEVDYTDRQRLILAEMRLAHGAVHACSAIQVDPDAMVADADAEALDKAGLIDVPTSWDLDGRAMARIEYAAGTVMDALGLGYAPDEASVAAMHAYAADLRTRLGLPAPAEGQWSTPWLNGPFTLPAHAAEHIAALKAENAARDARFAEERRQRDQDRQRRAERVGMARAHVDGLLAHAARPPAAIAIEGLATAAEGLDLPLPWRATEEAEVLAANDEQVVDCHPFGEGLGDAHVALAILIATTANTAAGLATPPLEITEAEQAIDGSDPDAGDDDTDSEGDDADA